VIPALAEGGPLPLSQPDWANITSVRLTGGAWVVTERVSYAFADQGLLRSDADVWQRLVPAYGVLVLDIPLLIAAALQGSLQRCGAFGVALTASARALLVREMRPGMTLWPVAIVMRKMTITFVVVVLGPYGVTVQLTAGLLVLIISLASHMEALPARAAAVNRLGSISLLTVGCTFAAGLFVASRELAPSVLQAASMLIVLGNAAFVAAVLGYVSCGGCVAAGTASCCFPRICGRRWAGSHLTREIRAVGTVTTARRAPVRGRQRVQLMSPVPSPLLTTDSGGNQSDMAVGGASRRIVEDRGRSVSQAPSGAVNPLSRVVLAAKPHALASGVNTVSGRISFSVQPALRLAPAHSGGRTRSSRVALAPGH
jgi:hypothetical protein